MSAETKAALELALQAHVSDECDNDPLVTEYIITTAITSFASADNDTHSYYMECSSNQAAHVTRGLADITTEWASSNPIFSIDEDD